MKPEILKWIKTTAIASVGGGIAAAGAAMFDPSKYRFPRDLGTGKLWPFFFEGAGMMFVGLLIRSPLGQQMMSSYRDSQAQLAESKKQVVELKQELGQKESDAEPEQPKH